MVEINNFDEIIKKQSTAVRTLVLPEVEKLVLNTIPELKNSETYKTNIKEWLRPILDLSNYSVYPTNGITEGLNWWMSLEERSIEKQSGDYQWVTNRSNNPETIYYQSIPSAVDGNISDTHKNVPLALDLAYVGSTKVFKIGNTKNVEYVFFSLSKSFGLRNIRTGWLFSKKPIERFEQLIYGAKYYNYYAHKVAENVISNFDIDYIYQKLSELQNKVCEKMDFERSDCVWLATTEDKKYEKFRRNDSLARISLAPIFNQIMSSNGSN